MSNILYYSKKCQHCKSMIVNISQSPVKSQIQFVCVDDLIKNGSLPSFIKSVPTIFKKDTNTILKGESANEWIRSFNTPIDNTTDEVSGFSGFGGMYSGLSEDGYAGAFSTGNTYEQLEHENSSPETNQNSFQEIKNDMKSQKQQLMDSAYDRMMAERESVGQPIART